MKGSVNEEVRRHPIKDNIGVLLAMSIFSLIVGIFVEEIFSNSAPVWLVVMLVTVITILWVTVVREIVRNP